MYPRRLKETIDQTRGKRRYARNNAAAPSANRAGSEFEMVSNVDDAKGLASSNAFVVCSAALVTVCQSKCQLLILDQIQLKQPKDQSIFYGVLYYIIEFV